MRLWSGAALAGILLASVATTSAEPLPTKLQGTWRITRVLPTSNHSCWNSKQALPLVGSSLTYSSRAMRWQGGEVPLLDIATRTVTAEDFSQENPGDESAASFTQLGIRAPQVIEVDMQHEDMDITGATTEVPGDSVLIASPNRIIVSACGVYFEANRTSGLERASLHR